MSTESLRLGADLASAEFDPSIGLIESASIARGVEITDAVMKEAPIRVLWARTVSPGKFVCLFTGEVDEVRAALRRGLEVGGDSVVDDLLIPSLHAGVVPAMRSPRREWEDEVDALGVIETRTVAAAIGAADAAAKMGHVALLELRLAMHIGGKGFVTLCGEVSDVSEALAAGAGLADGRGALVRTVLIPKPAPGLARLLLSGAGS